jgi:hypothetical protein
MIFKGGGLMRLTRFSTVPRSICIALVICLCLFSAGGTRAADSTAGLKPNTDAVITVPNAAFARIENGICEYMTTQTAPGVRTINSVTLSEGQTRKRISDTQDMTITLRSCRVDAATALKYSSMTPQQLGSMIASGSFTDSFENWDSSWSVHIRIIENHDKVEMTQNNVLYIFFRPVTTSGMVLYRDPQVTLTEGKIEQKCAGKIYSSPTPSAYIGIVSPLSPHYQSQIFAYPSVGPTYSMTANQPDVWYDIGPALSYVWPRWTVTIKRGTGTPWTAYADHPYGNPSAW